MAAAGIGSTGAESGFGDVIGKRFADADAPVVSLNHWTALTRNPFDGSVPLDD